MGHSGWTAIFGVVGFIGGSPVFEVGKMTVHGNDLFRSVIFQVFLAMSLIAGIALASMSMSVYVTVSAQNDAEAINLAGSMRMQSYRISHLLGQASQGRIADPYVTLDKELQEFSEKLYHSIIPEVVDSAGNAPLQKSYQQVLENWQQGMEPLLLAVLGGELNWSESLDRYDAQMGSYVEDIDYMVTHLQRDSEAKIELLGMTEAVSIMIILSIVVYLIMKADSNFVVPLRGLVLAAMEVEKGNLSHRVEYRSESELGLLSETFNNMTISLEAQYRTLEDQVAARTEELRKSNQALYFLYKTSREIASSPHDQRILKLFLKELKKVSDVELINLCISAEPNYLSYDSLSTDEDEVETCHGHCEDCALAPGQIARSGGPGISLPIQSRDDKYGFLYVRTGKDQKLHPWQNQLLTTVAETLSTAFAFHRTLGQEHRLILLEERSTIARELHDSLAQSLSYMKLEIARLKKLVHGGFEQQKIEAAIADLQEGNNAAYKHLRELLVTFRVKLDAPDLHSALEHAVSEFNEQTAARVSLDYRLDGSSLGPNGDIHVLHIVREALNNAVKHAQASQISLSCSRGNNGDIVFCIDDNGIGISKNPEKQHHYGLYTMRERAQRLHGTLTMSRRETGGTRVQLRIAGVTGLLSA